nr:retrovirus-related Pol polyprotein from transposon TNT 1-94 [Tanacetum cinerariifolium]
MFRFNPSKTSREEKQVPNTVSASASTKPITVSQPPVITKKDVNSDLNGLSSTGIDNTKTRRPQSNTKNDRVPSASKRSRSQNKEAESWLWHQRLSHLSFDSINDLARNDLVTGLPKFKYHKENLCPSCEQGKSKRASHPPKPVPNSRQRLHLLHMDLCGPMRIASTNGKRKLDISFLHVFGALCYPKNDREDMRKLGAK